MALDENDASALAGLADTLIRANWPVEALSHIEKAMRLDPHHPPSYLITLGAAQFGAKSYMEAISTFTRAAKRNPANEVPYIYLASSYGHLGRIAEAEAAILAANDLRFRLGKSFLSLRDSSEIATDPVDARIDFASFGETSVQDQLRTGLIDIPALKWQYRITQHKILGPGNTWYEVEGATEVDVQTAKSLYDSGALFIDVSSRPTWLRRHIPGSVNLPNSRTSVADTGWFNEHNLAEVAEKSQEIVMHCYEDGCHRGVWEAAKAATWGYLKLYFFKDGAESWDAAGFPVEKAE